MTQSSNAKLIDRWFPCSAVDVAVGTPTGSGRVEKAIFTWFASRPIAQARAAVLTALLPDLEETRRLVDLAVRDGTDSAITELSKQVAELYPSGRPVVLDLFSGRGIIPLEAARAGAVAVGIDLSPVATLAGRLLATYPLQDWSTEPALPFAPPGFEDGEDDDGDGEQIEIAGSGAVEPRLVSDVRIVLAEVSRRLQMAVEQYYPRNEDGAFPWGYLWAVTITCDGCARRFPLVGTLTLRKPYVRTNDAGQAFRIVTSGDEWRAEIHEGAPEQLPTFRAGAGKRGKSAHCPFCRHVHSLDAVKAKGASGDYRDAIIAVADATGAAKKTFRAPRSEELKAVQAVDLDRLPSLGGWTAVPDEPIPDGNVHTIRASGYGYRGYGDLMVPRQTVQFAEYARAIRGVNADLLAAGISGGYAEALASYAAANLSRGIKHATRGAKLRAHGKADGSGQNRVQVDHVFSDESKVAFGFDYFEAGPGAGPGTFASLAVTGLDALRRVTRPAAGKPVRFRQGSAMALPLRDGTVDAVVTDPPYYNMIDYADASDVFHVWLKRALSDIVPDLFGMPGLQDKSEEIIVKNGGTENEHRTRDYYEISLAKSFVEARRVLRSDGHLVVVFGHSDPEAWKRLLGALHRAGFVVTSSWPSRTESANTGVASIRVTVTIGCRVAPASRAVATAAQVDREVGEAVQLRVRDWNADGLALSDQMMASYGPAMEVYGRYAQVLQPDGSVAPLERYLTLARMAAREAMHLKLDQIPLETFDAVTRFAVFWMREHGRTSIPKGEALFSAQAESLRLDQVRELVLSEVRGGFKLVLDDPAALNGTSTPVFNVVRAMAAAWIREGSEGVAAVFVRTERSADDQHVWAVVGDLVAQLPPSDSVAKALTDLQRNRTAIQSLARGLSQRQALDDDQTHLPLSL